MNYKTIRTGCLLFIAMAFMGCFGGRSMSLAGRGGEVVGVGGGKPFSEPAPYGMVKVDRGFLHMGLQQSGEGYFGRWLLDGRNRGD